MSCAYVILISLRGMIPLTLIIQAIAIEIYKTMNDLNSVLMKEICSLKPHNYPLRTQNLVYPNPRAVSYGLELFGYKGSQIWKNIQRNSKIVMIYP